MLASEVTISVGTLVILCFFGSCVSAIVTGLLIVFASKKRPRRCMWYDRNQQINGELVGFILNSCGVPKAIVADENGNLTTELVSYVTLIK